MHNNDRVPRFMAKASLWKVPLLGKVMAGAGQIPVFRPSGEAAKESLRAAKDSLRAASEGLEQGKLLVIYPEGTITRDPDGWPMAPRTGVARLALANDVPVIPAARWGTRDLYDGYSKKFRPFPRKKVISILGEPIDLSAYRGQQATAQVLREVTDLLMGRSRSSWRRPAASRRPRASTPRSRPEERGLTWSCSAIAVLGAGSWGTTFAKVLADAGRDVVLWARRPEVADVITGQRRQPRLPARHPAAGNLRATADPRRRWTAPRPSCWPCRARRCAPTWRPGAVCCRPA